MVCLGKVSCRLLHIEETKTRDLRRSILNACFGYVCGQWDAKMLFGSLPFHQPVSVWPTHSRCSSPTIQSPCISCGRSFWRPTNLLQHLAMLDRAMRRSIWLNRKIVKFSSSSTGIVSVWHTLCRRELSRGSVFVVWRTKRAQAILGIGRWRIERSTDLSLSWDRPMQWRRAFL